MKRFLKILLICYVVIPNANAKTFSGNDNIYKFSDYENVIENGAIVNAKFGNPNIIISQPIVSVINHGTINGNIDINGNVLNIQNSGLFNGYIVDKHGGGTVKQIISSNSDFKKLTLESGINLYADISNVNNLKLDSLKDLNADIFYIKNSDIYIDDFSEWQNWNKYVYFDGNNNLHIEHVDTVNSGEVVKNVLNINNVNIKIDDIDVLHKLDLTSSAEGVVLNIVRETNYQKIFNDKRGDLLESLRDKNQNDKFISKLDSANNMHELENIMDSAYHFNHKILIKPLKVLNNFVMFDNDKEEQNINFYARYIGGDKTSAYGGFGRIGDFYKNVYFGIGVNFDKVNYSDDINDFDANVYGMNIKSRIDFDNLWINGIAGFSISDYKADNIYDKDTIKDNPRGRSFYGVLDIGHDFDVNDNITVNVFSGINSQYVKVLDINDVDTNLRIGSDIKYSYEVIGIKYDYSVGGAIATNGDLFGSIKLGFWSMADEAGASVNFDVIKSEYDFNYQASVNVKTMF